MEDIVPSQNSSQGKKKYRIILIVSIAVVLFVFFAFMLLSSLSKRNSVQQVSLPSAPLQNNASSKSTSGKIDTLPKLFIHAYAQPKNPVILSSQSYTVYQVKPSFSLSEVAAFASHFGIFSPPQPVANTTSVIVSNITDKSNLGYMVFETHSGVFSYTSYGVLKPKGYGAGQPFTAEAKQLLAETGMDDPTISCRYTYQKTTIPDETFVECHREWTSLGLPLLNPVGVLNIAESTKLSSLSPGLVTKHDLNDATIAHVTQDGNATPFADKKARPDDFNTVTIGFHSDGRIAQIDSRMRWINTSSSQTVSQNDIISPSIALSLFQQNHATFALSLPTGEGSVDWSKIYPNNLADAYSATIHDMQLVYVEKRLDTHSYQTTYEPYYLIRGVAGLNSGYRVKYVQALPALKKTLAQNKSIAHDLVVAQQREILHQAVAGASTDTHKELQMGTLLPPTDNIPDATINPPDISSICNGSLEDKITKNSQSKKNIQEITLHIPDYGDVIVSNFYDPLGAGAMGLHTFYIKSAPGPSIPLDKVKTAFVNLIVDQFTINAAKYLTVHPTKIASVDDAKNFFKNWSGGPHVMPGPYYDTDQMITIQNNVAQKIVDIENNNQLSEWATKNDIFIPKVNDSLNYLSAITVTTRQWAGQFKKIFGDAPCYLTGSSPSLFLYPSKETSVHIKTEFPLTYADPAQNGDAWNVIAVPNGQLKNYDDYNYLYYEYDKTAVHFAPSQTGFVISSNDIKTFITKQFANQIGFTNQEAVRMVQEIHNALVHSKPAPYLKLSLISENELHQQLPLVITPAPDHLYRIHFSIIPLEKPQSVINPAMTPMQRDGFTVVEVGARVR